MKQSNFSILYAEDEDNIRQKYTRFLKVYFKNVYEATNGQEALDIYNTNKPDIVLLDINMPIINGLQVAQRIRDNDKKTIIIMLTAYSDRDKLLIALDLYLYKYLIKPIQSLELEEIVIEAIEMLEKNQNTENLVFLENDFIWNSLEKNLYKNKKIIKLTQKELQIVNLFCLNPNQTFSNIDIMNYVWEDDVQSDFNTSKLRTIFSKLKTKLNYNLFQSIYNVGYKIKKQNN